MAASKAAVRAQTRQPVQRPGAQLETFVWVGTDKRGVRMKGEQLAKNANLLRAELRLLRVVEPYLAAWPQVAALCQRVAARQSVQAALKAEGLAA